MNQYFEVGEEVTLISKAHPKNNGDYVISHSLGVVGASYTCPKTGVYFGRHDGKPGKEPTYYLHGLEHMTLGLGIMKPWSTLQSSLRKKYPKGESFDTLMERLNVGVTA
jgi:hypothetical protein